MIFGTGFAPFRGGPVQYSHDTGVTKLQSRLNELKNQCGNRFEPSPGWELL